MRSSKRSRNLATVGIKALQYLLEIDNQVCRLDRFVVWKAPDLAAKFAYKVAAGVSLPANVHRILKFELGKSRHNGESQWHMGVLHARLCPRSLTGLLGFCISRKA